MITKSITTFGGKTKLSTLKSKYHNASSVPTQYTHNTIYHWTKNKSNSSRTPDIHSPTKYSAQNACTQRERERERERERQRQKKRERERDKDKKRERERERERETNRQTDRDRGRGR